MWTYAIRLNHVNSPASTLSFSLYISFYFLLSVLTWYQSYVSTILKLVTVSCYLGKVNFLSIIVFQKCSLELPNFFFFLFFSSQDQHSKSKLGYCSVRSFCYYVKNRSIFFLSVLYLGLFSSIRWYCTPQIWHGVNMPSYTTTNCKLILISWPRFFIVIRLCSLCWNI